jgi:hypothetical protein
MYLSGKSSSLNLQYHPLSNSRQLLTKAAFRPSGPGAAVFLMCLKMFQISFLSGIESRKAELMGGWGGSDCWGIQENPSPSKR